MLETICIHKLRVMRNIVFTDQEEKCRRCTDSELKECYVEYKPNEPLRKGKLAYELLRS